MVVFVSFGWCLTIPEETYDVFALALFETVGCLSEVIGFIILFFYINNNPLKDSPAFSWRLHVVVVPDVELAHRACTSSWRQPLVDAFYVEVMQARHGPYLFISVVVFYAYHALSLFSFYLRIQEFLSYFVFGQRVQNSFRNCFLPSWSWWRPLHHLLVLLLLNHHLPNELPIICFYLVRGHIVHWTCSSSLSRLRICYTFFFWIFVRFSH